MLRLRTCRGVHIPHQSYLSVTIISYYSYSMLKLDEQQQRALVLWSLFSFV